jgi:4-hydroxybenzoate polyprenyltransferase
MIHRVCKTIKAYLRLARIHSAVLMGLAPVCTAAAMGKDVSPFHYIKLFIIGLLFHIYLFVLNEIKDISIDKTSESLSGKPLVDGTVSIKNASMFCASSVILIIVLTIVFFHEQILVLLPISIVSLILGGLYDFFGKRLPHSDYLIAAMILCIAMYGGCSLSLYPSFFSFIIGLLAFTKTLINNILAGLKDIDHDYISGGISTPLRMGVRVEGRLFCVSKHFIVYIVVLKVIHIFLILFPFMKDLMPYDDWQLYSEFFIVLCACFFMIKLFTIKEFKREKIMRTIGFHEMFSFMVVPFLLFHYIGLITFITLIFLPALWLAIFLLIIYRRLLPLI